MKLLILVSFLITGCSSLVIAEEKPPGGREVFNILFKHLDTPLGNEKFCKVENKYLKDYLAEFFSLSYENKNLVDLKSSCTRSKYEYKNKSIVDVWDCRISILENNNKKEYISSSSITFSIDFRKTKVIRGSLRCL